jgi:hypothetical protein
MHGSARRLIDANPPGINCSLFAKSSRDLAKQRDTTSFVLV